MSPEMFANKLHHFKVVFREGSFDISMTYSTTNGLQVHHFWQIQIEPNSLRVPELSSCLWGPAWLWRRWCQGPQSVNYSDWYRSYASTDHLLCYNGAPPANSLWNEGLLTARYWCWVETCTRASNVGLRRFHNHRKAHTRTFSWLKAPSSAFTFMSFMRPSQFKSTYPGLMPVIMETSRTSVSSSSSLPPPLCSRDK